MRAVLAVDYRGRIIFTSRPTWMHRGLLPHFPLPAVMKHLRRHRFDRLCAAVLAMLWLPLAGERCLETRAGSSNAPGSINKMFGHHPHGSSSGHRHDDPHGVASRGSAAETVHDHAGPRRDAGRRHDQRPDDTCCAKTSDRSVIPSAWAGLDPPVAVAALVLWCLCRPLSAGHPEQPALTPVAHSPPIYLLNATLLI